MGTIAQALADAATRFTAAGIEDDARLEADVLLAHALGVARSRLLAMLRDELGDADRGRFETLVVRRERREPVAYITGRREFYGIDLAVGPGVLIPRPETELLVELALDEVRRRGDGLRIVDVGTGSGAIAVAVAVAPGATEQRAERREERGAGAEPRTQNREFQLRVVAIDDSEAALRIARHNVESQGVADCVEVRAGDLLEGAGVFDVILANLPYVAESEWAELEPEVRDWEPREALVGGVRGTEAIERLLAQAPAHLASGGVLAAEMGGLQGARLSAVARVCFPSADVRVVQDLAGLGRVLVVRV